MLLGQSSYLPNPDKCGCVSSRSRLPIEVTRGYYDSTNLSKKIVVFAADIEEL